MTLKDSFTLFIDQFGGIILGWGWLVVLLALLWIAWKTYRLIKAIDFLSGVSWTFLQVTVPEDSGQTPKSMENVYEVMGGMHKPPDVVEYFFEGYQDLWYSCELHCEPSRARYIMVVPTLHRKFMEGVIYGQYPSAEIREVEDYTQRYSHEELEKTFDVFGSEIVLVKDEIYPIRTYKEYEDSLAEDDKFIDPHQALVEAYTNIEEGEEFWFQMLVKPMDAKKIDAWEQTAEEETLKIIGKEKKTPPSVIASLAGLLIKLPVELLQAAVAGPLDPEDAAEEKEDRRFVFTPLEEARMKGLLQKTSRTGFKTKIRAIYLSPAGRFRKPAQGTLIGAFKQYNTFHMNSFKPDGATKTSGPTYFFKNSRRRFRKRQIFLYYQWRDFFGEDSGFMLNPEELATLYHFPIKYVRSPVIERAAAGLGSAPENLPYA